MSVRPKVAAATTGAAISAALVWAVEHYGFHDAAPAVLDLGLQAVVPSLVAFIAGWAKSEETRWTMSDLQGNTVPPVIPESEIHTRPADVPPVPREPGDSEPPHDAPAR